MSQQIEKERIEDTETPCLWQLVKVNKKCIKKYLNIKRQKSQDSAAPLPGIFSEPVTESNFDPQSDVSANTPQIWTTTNTVYLSFPDKKTKKKRRTGLGMRIRAMG